MDARRKPVLLKRRSFLAGVAGTLAAGATVVFYQPVAAINPDDPGIPAQLKAIATELDKVGNRMERINALQINPDDPNKPAIRANLLWIKSECAEIDGFADDMLERLPER